VVRNDGACNSRIRRLLFTQFSSAEFKQAAGGQMKPTHDPGSIRLMSRYDRPRRRTFQPAGACEFQPRRGGGFSFDGGGPARRPNFSRLAREVLRADASRTFAIETAVLGLITIVSFWPIAIMIHQVYRLLR
jgi:hypothetical protein